MYACISLIVRFEIAQNRLKDFNWARKLSARKIFHFFVLNLLKWHELFSHSFIFNFFV